MDSLRRTVAVLSGTVFLVMIGISIIVPALPQYGLGLSGSAFLAGVLVGALPVARVVLDLPSGAFGDRFGNRRMMQIGLGIIASASLAPLLVFDYAVLLAVRVAEGVGSAFYVTSSLASLAKRVPAGRRGRYMGIYVNGQLTGQIIGPVIGGAIVLRFGSALPAAPFAAYAAFAFVGLLLVTFGMERTRIDGVAARVDVPAVRRLLRDRSYMLVTVGTMGTFFVRAGLISTVLPLFIHLNWGVDPTLAITYTGVLVTTNAFATLLTLYPSGWLADRVGRKVPFVASLLLTAAISPFLFLTTDLPTAVPIMFVYGLALGLHGPLAAWTTDLTPREIMGTSMGLYRTLTDLGFLLGPVVLAAVGQLTMAGGRLTVVPFVVAAAWVAASGVLMAFARDPVGEARRHAPAGGQPDNST
ncbi:MAG: MFS transporter [Methanobacteriota archaeon]